MKRFIHRIYNIMRWLPVLWNDFDWDNYYIYLILHKKLSHMEKFFRNDSIIVESDAVANEIETAVSALQRLIDDKYDEVVMEDHDKKWGELKMELMGDGNLYFNRNNILSEEDSKQEKKEFLACCERVEYYRQADIDVVCDTMKNKIQGWWD